MKHKGCGGELYEHPQLGYMYCSTHGGECDPSCKKAQFIPAIYCKKCGQEIGGDAEIILEDYKDALS